ncbi:macro domain-like protein [Tothia fuscella]|uniref:Macro domain-like protein n=1 Tax=Tothia fuscella TaxID=1048955 RepID=A0A9P4NG26_9PEZI|nr:macro domain-like protein [Tothia fuscella]
MSSQSAQDPLNPRLPNIHLLCKFESASKAFKEAVKKYYPKLHDHTTVTIHNCSLARLPPDVQIDAIVSPANSYGFMDGAFDDAISIFLSPNPKEGYSWTTKKVQSALYKKSRGYAPPGSCTLIDNAGPYEESENHKAGCRYIALCPTMRVPHQVKWDREVIFECIWSLLCAIDTHNQEIGDEHLQIKNILMTPLATGVGRVSDAKWAAQCVLAMKYWVEAVENSGKWSNLQWEDVYNFSEALELTHGL